MEQCEECRRYQVFIQLARDRGDLKAEKQAEKDYREHLKNSHYAVERKDSEKR